MKEYKNIDELFKQGMSGLTIEPSVGLWKNIEGRFFMGGGFVWKWYHMTVMALILILADGSVGYFNLDFQNGDTKPTQSTILNENIPEQTGQPLINKHPTDHVDALIQHEKQENDLVIDDKEFVMAPINETVSLEETQEVLKSESLLSSGLDKNENDINQQNISSLTSKNIHLEDKKPELSIEIEKIPGLKQYLKKQKHTHFYTGASGHAGMVYYPSTKDQFTWSADLAFGLKVGKFYVETGVGYESMQERGIYLIELRGYDSVGFFNQVESFVIDPHSPNEIVYNTKEVTVYDSVNRYTHTTPLFKYNYVNIPVIFGYRFLEKKKFTVSVNTGIIFNFLANKEIPDSDYYSSDYTVVQTKNVTPERVDWNMRWQLGLRMNYNIARSLSVSAEPLFTKYLNSIYDTDKGYDNVKPYTMGVKIGIYYGF